MRIHLTVVAALAFAATSLMPALAAPPEKIGLEGLNNSGEIGEATLVAKGQKTLVSLVTEGGPHSAQPAYIHRGGCDAPRLVPAYRLNPVVRGRSTTLVSAPLDTLMSGAYAVDLRISAKNPKHFVACGQLLR